MEDKGIKVTSSVNIEVTKGERVYVFSIPAGAPFGECFDAAFESMDVIKGWHEKAQETLKESRPADATDGTEVKEEDVEVIKVA